ncbi:MAG TPA: imelysin family protein [Polyangiaceae bacterium]|jgi:putative iron-regulated protein
MTRPLQGRCRAPALISCAFLGIGCGRLRGSQEDPSEAVVRQYATHLHANYGDSVAQLTALKATVEAFVEGPTPEGFVACRKAWLSAHRWYGQGEISRFYGGPIDRAQVGMNEWPIDENFIDYTIGNPKGGLINDPATFPQITPPALASADEKGVETVSTGFHAVEFLLWGQRADQKEGPGTRPYTDYVDGGTAANQDRRRAYLSAATSMLLDDMRGLEAEWDLSDKNSYASHLVGDKPHDALTKIFRGLSQMAVSELFYERLFDPIVSLDRKDEESCFSESTHNDLVANALSVEDVYVGHYRTSEGTVLQGPSLSDLVRAKSPALDGEFRAQIGAVRAAIEAIPPPFDHAVLAPAASAENRAVQTAVTAFQPVQGTLGRIAQALGIVNNL